MPKRACPFTESFSSQYKVHVGQRELSQCGVFGNKIRQEVFALPQTFQNTRIPEGLRPETLPTSKDILGASNAKTNSLLFSGARAAMDNMSNVEGDEKMLLGSEPPPQPAVQAVLHAGACSQTLLRGQTLIGLDGRLTKATTAQGSTVGSSGCCVCQRSQGSRRPCAQCERPVCPSCIQQCTNCFNDCCSVCTALDYSGRYDQVVCCGCSS